MYRIARIIHSKGLSFRHLPEIRRMDIQTSGEYPLIEYAVPNPIKALCSLIKRNTPNIQLPLMLEQCDEARKAIDEVKDEFAKTIQADQADCMIKAYDPMQIETRHFYIMGVRVRGEAASVIRSLIQESDKQKQQERISNMFNAYLSMTPGGPSYPILNYPESKYDIAPSIGLKGHARLLNADVIEYEIIPKSERTVGDITYDIFKFVAITIPGEHSLNGTLIHEMWVPKSKGDVLFQYIGGGAVSSPLYGERGVALMDILNYDLAQMWIVTVKNLEFFLTHQELVRNEMGRTSKSWKDSMTKEWVWFSGSKIKDEMEKFCPGLSTANSNYRFVQKVLPTSIKQLPANSLSFFQKLIADKEVPTTTNFKPQFDEKLKKLNDQGKGEL